MESIAGPFVVSIKHYITIVGQRASWVDLYYLWKVILLSQFAFIYRNLGKYFVKVKALTLKLLQ